MDQPIDLVLPWVDSNDPEWREQKKFYESQQAIIKEGNSEIRYQNWDNLQYVFRGIEKFMPWVNRVFFVTCGQKPDWLNEKCEKLVLIDHSDYIPPKYLPTFNSNVIEMNYFRIPELSENFILFNDDLFPVSPIEEEYYFLNDKPCAEAIETHFTLKGEMNIQMLYSAINNMVLINKYFDKKKVLKENWEKWLSPVYGERVKQNIELLYWQNFESFVYPHEAKPIKKSILAEIWNKEYDLMDKFSCNKFRSYSDFTQQLITIWQICSGEFVPHKFKGKFFETDLDNCYEIADIIKAQKVPILSLNESTVTDFEEVKNVITSALDSILPDRSMFEYEDEYGCNRKTNT